MLRRWWKTVLVNCHYVTRGLYIALSGASVLPLSFLQLWILVYRQSNRIGLRDPLAVLVPRLTESLTVFYYSDYLIISFSNIPIFLSCQEELFNIWPLAMSTQGFIYFLFIIFLFFLRIPLNFGYQISQCCYPYCY